MLCFRTVKIVITTKLRSSYRKLLIKFRMRLFFWKSNQNSNNVFGDLEYLVIFSNIYESNSKYAPKMMNHFEPRKSGWKYSILYFFTGLDEKCQGIAKKWLFLILKISISCFAPNAKLLSKLQNSFCIFMHHRWVNRSCPIEIKVSLALETTVVSF